MPKIAKIVNNRQNQGFSPFFDQTVYLYGCDRYESTFRLYRTFIDSIKYKLCKYLLTKTFGNIFLPFENNRGTTPKEKVIVTSPW